MQEINKINDMDVDCQYISLENEISHKTAETTEDPVTYRPDIDGLRALAIIPVVIFHAYPELLKGGFIGVDIFFVISGYLISGILIKECSLGSFSYTNFYARRIRRVFPALIIVLTTTLIIGCAWLMAKPLQLMARTLFAGTIFGANIQLLTVSQGYFEPSVKRNPLLHLWSLGVEEQFYIFWPIFVAIVSRLSFRNGIVAQSIIILASFICNISFLGFQGANKYSFYFPLSRFWQMAIGGLLSYLNFHSIKIDQIAFWYADILSAIGLLFVILGLIFINEDNDFPGYWALLPWLLTSKFTTFLNLPF